MMRWKIVTWMVLIVIVLGACTPPAQPAAPAATQAPAAQQAAPTLAPPPTQVVAAPANTAAPEEEASRYGGTFTWGIAGDIPGFNPILNDWGDEIRIYQETSEPLAWGGENFPSEWRPILAESWDRSSDGMVWTIHLRKNVKWQDGTPFTADDVVFWAQAIQDKTNLGAEWMQGRLEVDSTPYKFEAVDANTVKITTVKPVPTLIGDICVPLIPAHYFKDKGIANVDMAKDPFNTDKNIGTGPFMMAEYKKGEAVILKAFADYWGGKPYLDNFVYRLIPEEQARLTALQNGEIDFARIAPKDVAVLKDNPNIKIMAEYVDMEDQFRFNVGKPTLADKRIRQALVHALDRQAILQAVYMGYGRIADSPFTPFTTAYEALPQYDYNPEKAQQMIEEVGWVKGSDGVYVADHVQGVEKGTRFTIEISSRSTDSEEQKPDVMAQAYWKAIGIDTTIRQIDSNVFDDENSAKADKKYDVTWSGTGFLGGNGLSYGWLMADDKVNAPTSYQNDTIRDLFNKAKAEEDKTKRDDLLKQAAKIYWEDVPSINLYYNQRVYAFNTRVHLDDAGFNVDLLRLFEHPEKIWVDQ